MARAIWNGSIGFGLVQIPVAVFPAEKAGEVNTVPEAIPKKRREQAAANVIDLAELLARSVAGSKKADKRRAPAAHQRVKQERQRKSA